MSTHHAQLRNLEMEKRDARTVVAVILGGGAGTRLFPLTKRRAKPAVCLSFSFSFNRKLSLQEKPTEIQDYRYLQHIIQIKETYTS